MKRIMNWIIFVSICLVCMAFVFGCRLISSTNDGREVSMKDYYTREDFQSIVIGKSTYQDVYVIAPIETLQITSYGEFCDYPMQNGGYVRIKFYEKNLIVGDIEEISLPPETKPNEETLHQ